ncbi:MAG: penicillin-binding protein [Spirochaetae bacterium HGW-Spirochaetae-3]|jgi:penicillin-binding protein 1A|nr:MAG: penicillin-binding protein [Spirochaetae bacterium HGW-Spirochaetae-3]
MASSRIARTTVKTLIIVAVASAVLFGVAFGVAIASVKNIVSVENFTTFEPPLPSKLLDSEGRIITEFASNEKREIVSIKDVPQHLIDALVTREDQSFWTHPGFTFRGYLRAAVGIVTGKNLGGGSTITLQLAGTLYADRKDISFRRKFVELWWALQLERRFSKQEIIEMYMNRMIMGPGVYGVEAASKYFFGHSARDVTVAESAILVIQLSSPTRYNPIRNPNIARERSREVLDQMVDLGYIGKESADDSFARYWDNYDYTRVANASFYSKDDKAPWFSEYVRRQLEDMLYGSTDLYKDGLTIHTTLNLDYQAVADKYMNRYIAQVNREYASSSSQRLQEAERIYAPMAEMLGLAFNLEGIFFQETKIHGKSMEYYRKEINPTVDALALMFGLEPLKAAANASYGTSKTEMEKNIVEGALITIENDTGHIKAIVGGSKFDQSNQLIRATQAQLMPGSCFKPLFYSAAIDSRRFTPGTLIYDAPVVFYNEDGTPYIPLNYKGEWMGQVLTWYALAKSMNVPAVKVLDGIGFDAAINRAAALLDITDPDQIRTTFPRVYPLALGISQVSPLRMARAFAVFANQGREVTPISIRSIEDRSGRPILDPEKDLRAEQKKKGSSIQVISPQNAYVMTDLLKRVVKMGTLAWPTSSGAAFTYKDPDGKRYTIPAAGKTGTTQNWADAWTVGYTPYMTTAIWFGFDRPGNSLGVSQSGAAIAGIAWANYMAEIHRGLPYRDFIRPQSGLIDVTVCSVSGLLPTEYCDEGTVSLTYYEGTQPKRYCDLHQFKSEQAESTIRSLSGQQDVLGGGRIDSTLDFDPSDLDALLRILEQRAESAPPEASGPDSTPAPGAAPPVPEQDATDILD